MLRAFAAAAACGVALGLAVAISCGMIGCFDVLHDTSELRTACEIDPSGPGCATASACQPSRADARRAAEHACAWLGACETPMGHNAIGPCMLGALTAFDCEASPSHPARGKQAAAWRCLAAARSCPEVDACVFRETCSPRPGTSAGGECSATAAPGCVSECVGATLTWCGGGVLAGIDCASSGRQGCAAFPAGGSPSWVACLPEPRDAATCAPVTGAGCSSGVALSCLTGVLESIDCTALLGELPDASTCREGELDPTFDWTSPCQVDPPACASDTCDGGAAIGCARGAPFSVHCAAAGLGSCSLRSTDLGTQVHAACGAPPGP